METIERVTNPSIREINCKLNSTKSTGVEVITRYDYDYRKFFIGFGGEEVLNFKKLDIPRLQALNTLLFRVDGLTETGCWIERDRAKMEIIDILRIFEGKIPNIILQADHEGIQSFIMNNYAPGSSAKIRSLGEDGRMNNYILLPSTNVDHIAKKISERRRVVIVDDGSDYTETIIDKTKGNDSLSIISAQPEKIREYARGKGYRCD